MLDASLLCVVRNAGSLETKDGAEYEIRLGLVSKICMTNAILWDATKKSQEWEVEFTHSSVGTAWSGSQWFNLDIWFV